MYKTTDLISYHPHKGAFYGDEKVITMIDTLESVYSILNKELYHKVYTEYMKYKSTYDLKHNRPWLLNVRILHLVTKCKSNYPPDMDKVKESLKGFQFTSFTYSDLTTKGYPNLLDDRVIDIFKALLTEISGYVNMDLGLNYKEEFIYGLRRSYLMIWPDLVGTNRKSRKAFQAWVFSILDMMVNLADEDNRAMILNVIERYTKKLRDNGK